MFLINKVDRSVNIWYPNKDSAHLLQSLTLVILTTYIEARKMAKWFRTLATLAEDPGSIPRTHMLAHNYL